MNVERVFNFSAGPAVLPESVLAEAQRDLMTLPGLGMSVLELSHRSSTVVEIMETTATDGDNNSSTDTIRANTPHNKS